MKHHPTMQGKCHHMIVNVSPIDRGHTLFVPEPESCLPQVNHMYFSASPGLALVLLFDVAVKFAGGTDIPVLVFADTVAVLPHSAEYVVPLPYPLIRKLYDVLDVRFRTV